MADDFLEIRLPEDIERGASGGPMFNTTVNEQQSGIEQRNQNWVQPLRKWSFSFGMDYREKYTEILNFFTTVRGRAYGFRFRDWSDFELDNEFIGVGDGTTRVYNLIKSYSFGGLNQLIRQIKKPVADGFVVTVDDIVQDYPSDYTVDFDTGVLTFKSGLSTPDVGEVIRVSCKFDIPVRFDQDTLNIQLEYYKTGSVSTISIKELRR